MKITPYSPEIEATMRDFYQSLCENDRRRYAAVEAKKLGYGGISYICRVLQCNDRTVTRGLAELHKLPSRAEKRIRLLGGGRKKVITQRPDLDAAFLRVLENHTAGSPMNETIKWTNLTREEIATHLQRVGFTVRPKTSDAAIQCHIIDF